MTSALTAEDRFGLLVGKSEVMHSVYQQIIMMSLSSIPVLIQGETGTGKELAARTLHECGTPQHPFVPINCREYPADLFEAELFGYVKGAFTGARSSRPGAIAQAQEGTLFLDEIGDLPLHQQPHLLRMIAEREYRPVGSSTVLPLCCRIIAATNMPLKQAVVRGAFREDLYHRLNMLTIHMPPLRAHQEDIPLLIHHFLEQEHATPNQLSPTFWHVVGERTRRRDWPGNVRTLQKYVFRGICLDDAYLDTEWQRMTQRETGRPLTLLEYLSSQKKEYILRIWTQYQKDKDRVAEMLDISIKTLERRLKEYQIE